MQSNSAQQYISIFRIFENEGVVDECRQTERQILGTYAAGAGEAGR